MKRSVVVVLFLVACGGSVISNGDGGSNGSDGSAMSSNGIACGTSTCKPGMEACCIQMNGSPSCLSTVTGDCSGPVFRVTCDDKDDCGGQTCCFTNVLQSAEAATACTNGCGASFYQVCKRGSDCPGGSACNTFACGGSFGTSTITLGLCTSTAPMFCK